MKFRATLRKFLLRFALVALGLFVGLAIAEVLVRIFVPHAMDYVIPRGTAVMDRTFGWKLQPHSRGLHHSQYFDVEYAINSLGIRDPEREPSKATETRRYLLYGDSQIFGWGIPVEKRFSDLIDQRLPEVEIWNCGVYAYGLDQEILMYEARVPNVPADEVIFWVSNVTLNRTRLGYMGGKHKPRFEVRADGSLALVPIPLRKAMVTQFLYRMLSPFHLPQVVLRQLKGLRNRIRQAEAQSAAESGLTELDKKLLLKAQALARERQHAMTVLSEISGKRRDELRGFCTENEIGFMAIQLPPWEARVIGEQDRHWNQETNRLIAEQLAPLFRR